jgi:hypothetical protein
MEWLEYNSVADTSTSFIVNETGNCVKVDTIKRYYRYGNYYCGKCNKIYYIYHNDTLYQEMKYYKNRLWIEDFYTQGIKIKKKVYSTKRSCFMEKIFYFSENRRYKTEIYNKKGELIKEINE